MAKRVRMNITKMQIIREATSMIIENGYSNTTFRGVAKELEMNTGLITFYFPTKEHLLALLIDKLCSFQWKLMDDEADEGISSVLAMCLELMSMAAAAEEEETAKDFFVSAYQSSLCLEIIQRNDTQRAKAVFAQYCPDWTDENFREAETLVSGIEYATLNTNSNSADLETRIFGALRTILAIYNVPEDVIKTKIEKVSAMDYRAIGRRIFKEFKTYIEEENKQAFENLLV